MKMTGIYLAAGNSLRMGREKLSLPLGKKRLGMWALEKAVQSNLDEIIVISNQANYQHYKNIDNKKLKVVELSGNNKSESIKAGLDLAITLHSDAVMIILADQPFISSKMLNRLMAIYKQDITKAFVAPTFKGNIGPPILISKILFPDLYKLEGDQGAKQTLIDKRQGGILVPFDDETIFMDIDRRDEYLSWERNIESMNPDELYE
ncbi:xanthine dehydrogenase [Pradoshia eiseniae]|uniref:Xanthine dehydrogenase n=2 Tax=Pradoshia eiseniae TaxID=2064768 RepID=A0A2S7MZU6_9BACI|nr:xanthine dehydrogenase [Pradoshia eiseniae]